jgi:DNA-binding NarL/FixJ family response regulator
MKRARILLANDHELLLEAFKKLLEPEFEVVGTAPDGRALLRMAAELKPDLIVLDISMPLLNGLDAGRQVKIILPAVKLIYLTMNQDLDLVTEALQIGANGYVLKNSGYSELRKAISRGLLGRTYVTPLVTQQMDGYLLQDPMRRKQIIRLTARQREVLQLLAEGRSMKEAAHILNVTPRTVAFHKYRMMEDFNIHSNAELIKFAVRQHVA